MNKLLTVIFLVAASFCVQAQAPIYVYVDTEIKNGDTLRTFYIEDNYCKTLITHYTQEYGVPQGAGSGNMLWKNVDIPGIGTNLTVHFNDGAQIFDGNNWSHSTFLNGADMMAKLSADPARARRMYITIKKGNKNKVDSQAKEDLFVTTTEQILLAE